MRGTERPRPDDVSGLVADLVDQHYAALFDYLYWLLDDRDTARQAAQEVFLRALDRRMRLARTRDLRTWLFRVATDVAATVLAADAVGKTHQAFAAHGGFPGGWGEPGDVERALGALPLKYRALLVLHGHCNYDLASAARILGIRKVTATAWLREAYAACHRVRTPVVWCEEQAALLPLLLDYSRLAPADRSGAEAHLQGCPSCRAFLASCRLTDTYLAHLPEVWPERRAMALLADSIRKASVADLPRIGAPAPRRVSFPRIPVSGALVTAIVVILAFAYAGARALRDAGSTAGTASLAAAVTPTPTPAPTRLPTPTPVPRPPGGDPADVPGPATTSWLADNLAPIHFTEPGIGYGDLSPMLAAVGSAQVVLLDDNADFGSHEVQAFRQRLLELLVREKGFNTLILQVDWVVGERFNEYIHGAPIDPLQVLELARQRGGPSGGLWQTQEMLYTLRWLHDYNALLTEDKWISIHGFLPIEMPSDVPLRIIRDYLYAVDGRTGGHMASQLIVQGDAKQLLAALQERESYFLKRSDAGDFYLALSAARALVQYDMFVPVTTADQRAVLEDAASLVNMMYIASERAPGGKQILWTQSLGDKGAGSMEGLMQGQRRGLTVVTLGFAFDLGSLYLAQGNAGSQPDTAKAGEAGGAPGEASLAAVTLPPAVAGSYESYFAGVDQQQYFLDLRRAFGQNPETAWLRGPHLDRTAPARYSACAPEAAFTYARLNRSYDVVVFFQQVTPANLLFKPPVSPAQAACAPRPPTPLGNGSATQ